MSPGPPPPSLPDLWPGLWEAILIVIVGILALGGGLLVLGESNPEVAIMFVAGGLLVPLAITLWVWRRRARARQGLPPERVALGSARDGSVGVVVHASTVIAMLPLAYTERPREFELFGKQARSGDRLLHLSAALGLVLLIGIALWSRAWKRVAERERPPMPLAVGAVAQLVLALALVPVAFRASAFGLMVVCIAAVLWALATFHFFGRSPASSVSRWVRFALMAYLVGAAIAAVQAFIAFHGSDWSGPPRYGAARLGAFLACSAPFALAALRRIPRPGPFAP